MKPTIPTLNLFTVILALHFLAGCSSNKATLELNKKIVREYAEREDAGKTDFVEKYVNSDFVFHYPNGAEFTGIENLKKAAAELKAAFPDLKHQIHDMIAEGDMVATRYTITGTHKGEYNGVAPTGKILKFTAIDIGRIKDGKIIEAWIEFDPKAFNEILTSE